ncbi:Glutamate receptor ionotropic, NMDA 2A [Frankliniella fusca]|uniref:Glutamate receptor ionotropic, NMDA 2A n=1 Tax=Frankliniella fusca TaxID=407009 RepID=A0AAE1H297_9NEOP|nr:Glutamate receptor ionotropic, NMDA 2A [Frankliniella fusca]
MKSIIGPKARIVLNDCDRPQKKRNDEDPGTVAEYRKNRSVCGQKDETRATAKSGVTSTHPHQTETGASSVIKQPRRQLDTQRIATIWYMNRDKGLDIHQQLRNKRGNDSIYLKTAKIILQGEEKICVEADGTPTNEVIKLRDTLYSKYMKEKHLWHKQFDKLEQGDLPLEEQQQQEQQQQHNVQHREEALTCSTTNKLLMPVLAFLDSCAPQEPTGPDRSLLRKAECLIVMLLTLEKCQ